MILGLYKVFYLVFSARTLCLSDRWSIPTGDCEASITSASKSGAHTTVTRSSYNCSGGRHGRNQQVVRDASPHQMNLLPRNIFREPQMTICQERLLVEKVLISNVDAHLYARGFVHHSPPLATSSCRWVNHACSQHFICLHRHQGTTDV